MLTARVDRFALVLDTSGDTGPPERVLREGAAFALVSSTSTSAFRLGIVARRWALFRMVTGVDQAL